MEGPRESFTRERALGVASIDARSDNSGFGSAKRVLDGERECVIGRLLKCQRGTRLSWT